MNSQSNGKDFVGRVRRWLNGEYVVTPHKPGMGLTRRQQVSEYFRQFRWMLNASGNPFSDAYVQRRVTSRHIRATWWGYAVVFTSCGFFLLLFGRFFALTWVLIEVGSCVAAMYASAVLPTVIAIRRNPKLRGIPVSTVFAAISNVAGTPPARQAASGLANARVLLTMLVVGHICMWVLRSYALTVLQGRELLRYRMLSPYVTFFFPEVFMAIGMAIGYGGTLLQSLLRHRWQRRLDEERLRRESAEHGQALAQAQLKMLQAQIEPHFLFNTLASVQHLVRKDPPRADFMLSQLIRYLREAMPDIRGIGSTLGREFGLAEAYLNIARIRLDGRLEIKVNTPPELTDISFPALIVQTLVENAIKHGIEPKPGPVHIEVTANETTVEGRQFIDVCVSDDGVGFGTAETMGTGVGLRNIRERLAGLYGSSASLSIAEVQPSGVCAIVRIPTVDFYLPSPEQVSAEESFLAQSWGGINRATRGSN